MILLMEILQLKTQQIIKIIKNVFILCICFIIFNKTNAQDKYSSNDYIENIISTNEYNESNKKSDVPQFILKYLREECKCKFKFKNKPPKACCDLESRVFNYIAFFDKHIMIAYRHTGFGSHHHILIFEILNNEVLAIKYYNANETKNIYELKKILATESRLKVNLIIEISADDIRL